MRQSRVRTRESVQNLQTNPIRSRKASKVQINRQNRIKIRIKVRFWIRISYGIRYEFRLWLQSKDMRFIATLIIWSGTKGVD